MRIPQQAVSVGFNMLDMKEDKILEMLGEELYRIEAQQTCSNLGSFSSVDNKLKAEEFIGDNFVALRRAMHPKWKGKARENFGRNTLLFSDFISDIGDSIGRSSTFVSVAMIVAVWIINKGIDKFCAIDIQTFCRTKSGQFS